MHATRAVPSILYLGGQTRGATPIYARDKFSLQGWDYVCVFFFFFCITLFDMQIQHTKGYTK